MKTADRSKTFVLVHGGWHGGWCWAETAEILRRAGHRVFTPTLTGLGERSHLAGAVEGPETHVTDIENTLIWNELSDVILVGHSYGGVIITGVASRQPGRIAHLVYLDAFVPDRTGQSAADMGDPKLAARRQAAIDADGLIAPDLFEKWSSDPDKITWLKRMTTPHPASCFDNGVDLSGAEKTVPRRSFVLAGRNRPSHFERFFDRFKSVPDWQTHELPCLHDIMVEMPAELAHLLLEA